MDILHNPLAEIYGPDFLKLYGVVIAIALGACWVIVSVADTTKNLPLPLVPAQPDAYEIGYLQGAEEQIAQLTVFNLIERRLLQVDKKNIEQSPNYDNTDMLQLPGAEMTEVQFLTEIVERSDCGLLLDVTNLYINAVNHDNDVCSFLEQLPLERVVQLHFVGGHWHDGVLIDSHSHSTPLEIWKLMDEVVSRIK